MSKFASFIGRVREGVSRAFSGRRLTNTAIINGVRDESNQRRKGNGAPTPVGQLLTPLATSYLGTWALPRLIASNAKPRAQMRNRLERAHDAWVGIVVAGRMFLRRPDLPVIRAEYEALLTDSHSTTTTVRSHSLPLAVYIMTLVVSAVVDWPFFFGILMDAQDASPKSPDYWSTVMQSAALATLTPVLVMLLSEWGGRRLARTRWEVRELLDARKSGERVGAMTLISLLAVPVVIVLALIALVCLFAVFAQHRFASLTAGPGAVSVDPWLLAMLIAIVPIAALIASVVHHDLASTHLSRTTQKWEAIQAQIARNQEAQRTAMLEWTMAWGALRDLIGRLVAEGQISIQTWEHLVLRGLAIANQRGETEYTVDDVTPTQAVDSSSTIVSGRLSTLGQRASLIDAPVRQVATSFASADWVLDELGVDLEWLIIHAPDSTESLENEIETLMKLAMSATGETPETTASGARDAGLSQPTPPVSTPPSTGELETMFAQK